MKSWSLRIAFAVVILVLVGLVAVFLLPAPKPVSMPSPNGYDDFVAAAAAASLTGGSSNYLEWTLDELMKFVANNSNVFALVKAGLAKESRAPAVRTQVQWDQLESERLAPFKNLAQTLAARCRLEKLEGKTAEAVQSSLDGVQVAHGIWRGGVLIESQLGLSCEQIALREMPEASDLAGKTALAAARRLAELDARVPPLVETLANDRAFLRSAGAVTWALMKVLNGGMYDEGVKRFEAKWAAQMARRRELILLLARRAYEVEKGHPPANDNALVPDFLPALPQINANLAPRSGSP